ncbi:FmdB family zinc ribbon protein [Nonomuraea typhae]|uniref:FmdB family zinc ribbon protein n=1 Tax=Nonomuraea typhae TaxID=2603600 RepID=UPI0012FCD62C|nr:FmdB family zinc ribbon protein [Nonomuraea typhae]
MPTYQYVCNDCGQPLEVVQKFSDDALTVCPTCEGSLRKIFSAAAIVFKGSGFYKTDNRSSSTSATTTSSTEKSSTSSEKSSSTSSEKSAAAPAAASS